MVSPPGTRLLFETSPLGLSRLQEDFSVWNLLIHSEMVVDMPVFDPAGGVCGGDDVDEDEEDSANPTLSFGVDSLHGSAKW